METSRLRLSTVIAGTAVVGVLEFFARTISATEPGHALIITGTARLLAIWALIHLTRKMLDSLAPIGLNLSALWPGIKRGIVWSLAFASLVALAFAACSLAGINPLKLIKVTLPPAPKNVLVFFVVGAGVAPIAEEIYFRGLIYGYLRRWGTVAAVMGSTLLFVAAHPNLQQVPFPQIIGGLVFAVAYEVEKKLMVPIVIHASGNLALFSLSLIR